MRASKDKVTLKYSKSRQEFVVNYPEYKNRNGKITASFLSGIFDMAEARAKELGFDTLGEYFKSGGFDIETFKISINAKMGQKINIREDDRCFT